MKVLRPVVALGALVLLASPAFGQDKYASLFLRGGYVMTPTGTASDFAAGQGLKGQSSLGGDVYIALGSRLHLGGTFDWAHHSQKQPPDGTIIGGADDPQYNVFHTFLKLSFDLVDQGKFGVSVNAGPGMVFFSPNDVLRAQAAESDRHFAVNGGAVITWWFSDRIGLAASGQADYILKRSGGHLYTDKGVVYFPLTGGLRFKL